MNVTYTGKMPQSELHSSILMQQTPVSTSPRRLGVAIFALVVIGYPLTASMTNFVPFDSQALTVPFRILVLSLSILAILQGIGSRKNRFYPSLILIFFLLYSIRLGYDFLIVQEHEIFVPIYRFFGIVALPTIAVGTACYRYFSDRLLLLSLLVLGTFFMSILTLADALGLTYNPWAHYGVVLNRLWFEALNPISIGHAAGLLISLSVIFLLSAQRYHRKLLVILTLLLATYLLVSANSRGPIVSTILCLAMIGMSRFQSALKFFPLLLLLVPFADLILIEVSFVLERFDFSQQLDRSALERLTRQENAFNDFLANPLFGAHHKPADGNLGNYPHNLFLEVAMATGVIGLTAIVLLVWKTGMWSVRTGIYTHPALTIVFVHTLIASQFSGALWTGDALFCSAAVILGVMARQRVDRRRQLAAAMRPVSRPASVKTDVPAPPFRA